MMVQFLLIPWEINSTEGFDVASMGKRPKDKAIQLYDTMFNIVRIGTWLEF